MKSTQYKSNQLRKPTEKTNHEDHVKETEIVCFFEAMWSCWARFFKAGLK